MKNSEMPATPCDVKVEGDESMHYPNGMMPCSGLTKRETMAMHMMQGILTGQDTNEMAVGDDKCFAEFAAQCADALLAELERTK